MSQKKQIFKIDVLKKLLSDKNSCVSLVPTTRVLALPPFFLNDMKSGIIYLLNNLLKKYDRALDGILIGYQNIKVLMDENTGIIQMGTAETEVNVSVEFYIFQPKIGNSLEGVINKKSNNHIGCLVHKYFNATILKPEDIEFEDWICKDYNVDDKIIFKVKDLDFTGLLPYIEGIVEDGLLESKQSNFREKKSSDGGIMYKIDCKKDTAGEEEEETDTAKDEIINSLGRLNFSDKKAKSKHVNEEEVDETDLDETLYKLLAEGFDENDSGTDRRKKKKKEKEKVQQLITDFVKKAGEVNTSQVVNKTPNQEKISDHDYSPLKKKKRKKKECQDVVTEELQDPEEVNGSEVVNKNSNQEKISENDHTPYKKKKRKKKEDQKVSTKELQDPKEINSSPVVNKNLNQDKISDDISPHKKKKRKMEECEKVSTEELQGLKEINNSLVVNKSSNQDKISDDVSPHKKKKRKIEECLKVSSEEIQNPKEINKISQFVNKSSNQEKISDNDHTPHKKKKKKKEEGQKVSTEEHTDPKEVALTNRLSESDKEIFERIINSSKTVKDSKKEKKHKHLKGYPENGNSKTDKCLVPGDLEDNLFHSTQLDQSKDSERFRISFCSPIFRVSDPKKKKEKKSKTSNKTLSTTLISLQKDPIEETKSSRKRKKDDMESDVSVSKKAKYADERSSKEVERTNGETKTETDSLLKKIYEEQMSRVKERWGTTNGDASDSGKSSEKSSKHRNKKIEGEVSLYDKLLAQARNSLNIEVSDVLSKPSEKKVKEREVSTSSTGDDKVRDRTSGKKKKRDKKDSFLIKKLTESTCNSSPAFRTNEDKNLFSESEASFESRLSKKVNGDVKKDDVQTIIDKLCKEEMERLSDARTSDLESGSKKEKIKKSKSKEKKKEKTSESLFQKLMNDAKLLMNL